MNKIFRRAGSNLGAEAQISHSGSMFPLMQLTIRLGGEGGDNLESYWEASSQILSITDALMSPTWFSSVILKLSFMLESSGGSF